ncbi:Alcohol dehydrogenase 2 [Fusarium oxysporum f. sp. albedinis]|nr:Alcohol dehydrogenase 2 [Fusarium oxysporum f. sp. albedinis]
MNSDACFHLAMFAFFSQFPYSHALQQTTGTLLLRAAQAACMYEGAGIFLDTHDSPAPSLSPALQNGYLLMNGVSSSSCYTKRSGVRNVSEGLTKPSFVS